MEEAVQVRLEKIKLACGGVARSDGCRSMGVRLCARDRRGPFKLTPAAPHHHHNHHPSSPQPRRSPVSAGLPRPSHERHPLHRWLRPHDPVSLPAARRRRPELTVRRVASGRPCPASARAPSLTPTRRSTASASRPTSASSPPPATTRSSCTTSSPATRMPC